MLSVVDFVAYHEAHADFLCLVATLDLTYSFTTSSSNLSFSLPLCASLYPGADLEQLFRLRQVTSHSPCRFAPRYTQEQILNNSSDFVRDIFYWDGQFHQNGVGLNTQNGLTYDGCILNGTTGIANQTERHDFSAPSKEVQHPNLPPLSTLTSEGAPSHDVRPRHCWKSSRLDICLP